MPAIALNDLPGLLPVRGRLLGLDLGDKTIGLAVSDRDWRVATPVETIRRRKFTQDAQRLIAVIHERQVAALVLGLPVNMDGTEGPRCQSTRQFARNLEQVAGLTLPIALWDERLSTQAVERFLVDEMDLSRTKRARVVDQMAAGYILQGALEALNRAMPNVRDP